MWAHFRKAPIMSIRKLVAVFIAMAVILVPSAAFAQEESDVPHSVPDLPESDADLDDEDPVDDASEVPTCHGLEATILGTDGDDVIVGTPERDVIIAFAGNDVIRGKGGSDVICAGSGDDRVFGGGGHDAIFGGRGDDRISGNRSGDLLHGGAGDDKVIGRAGRDILMGGLGNDILLGNAHADVLRGGPGADLLAGGRGRPDICDGGLGADIATRGCEVVISAAWSWVKPRNRRVPLRCNETGPGGFASRVRPAPGRCPAPPSICQAPDRS